MIKNLNELAKYLSQKEEGKRQADITEIKDLLNNLFDLSLEEIAAIWLKYQKIR